MDLEKQVKDYYDDKLNEFGVTPRGVDWNSEESQFTRFEQLCKVLPSEGSQFSLLDFGCGFGSLADYLQVKAVRASIVGFDLSENMINAARDRHPESSWTSEKEKLVPCEYALASGIFNVKLEIPEYEWQSYIESTLGELNRLSTKGFSVNMLTSYSDRPLMKDYLYYADPLYFFDYCKRNYSRNVALLHDYELYEFTLIIRK